MINSMKTAAYLFFPEISRYVIICKTVYHGV